MRKIVMFSYFPPKSGGVSKAAFDLASSFANFGWSVEVITPPANTGSFTLPEVAGVTVRNDLFSSCSRIADWEKIIHAELKNSKPDLVFLNGQLSAAFLRPCYERALLRVLRNAKIPVIFRSHGVNTSFRIYWKNLPFFGVGQTLQALYSAIRWEWFCRRFSACVYLSAGKGVFRNFDRLLACLFHPGNTQDIPNAFLPFSTADISVGDGLVSAGNEPLFLFLADASIRKNQLAAIRAIKRTIPGKGRFLFLMPNRNRYAVSCEAEAGSDPRIFFRYQVPRKMVEQYILGCDCMLLFSISEQQPLVILEAMSCGKPWICSNVGNVGTLKGGIVIPCCNGEKFREAIEYMMDPGERERLGRAGRKEWNDHYSVEAIGRKWESLFNRVVRGVTSPA